MARVEAKVSDLIGQTITQIEGAEVGSDYITFHTADGGRYRMFHYSDCCEVVDVNEIIGDLDDLLNTPILDAREEVNPEGEYEAPENRWDSSETWTFYKFQTIKGNVTLRWLGTSNGYYSESVYFEKES
jgi:hypothetical protein